MVVEMDRRIAYGIFLIVFVSLFLIVFVSLLTPTIAQEGAVRPKLVMAPENPAFLQYLQDLNAGKAKLQTAEGHWTGNMPSPVDLSHLKGSIFPQSGVLPPSYDLRSLGRVTSVKDQGDCGSCWAHATYGSLESYLLPGETWDFSEQNLKNTHGYYWGHCDGGNSFISTAYLTRWSGPVDEADDPYNIYNSYSNPYATFAQKHVQDIYFLPDRTGPLDNNNIKQAVITYGATYIAFEWDEGYYNYPTYSYYNPNLGQNHAVDIVGWDDAYPVANFNTPPPGPGAWIIKNSWGLLWGQSGYFYMSYYTPITQATVFTAESRTNYNTVYQYDHLGWTSSWGYSGKNYAWFANIFTANATTESLVAVGLYAPTNNTSYQLYVYKNVDSRPKDGTLAGTKTGTIPTAGYHKVNLASSIPLTQGQRFSIVVKMTTPNYNWPIAAEFRRTENSDAATANAGESFVSENGTWWDDISFDWPNTNVCLKAFTNASNSLTEFQVTTDTSDQIYPDVWEHIAVWEDYRNVYLSSLGITKGEELRDIDTQKNAHALGESTIVQSASGADIYGKDLNTNTEFQVTTNSSDQYIPAIYKNIIVWEDWRNGNADIYGYDMGPDGVFGTADDVGEFQVTTDASDQWDVAIWGRNIVWEDYRNDIWGDIYGYDMGPDGVFGNADDVGEFVVCTANSDPDWSDQYVPKIHENIIVWLDYRWGGADIFGYDMGPDGIFGTADDVGEFEVTSNPATQQSPDIYGNNIVWRDDRNWRSDIYGLNLSGAKYRLTTNEENQRYPAIWGNGVVWVDFRNGNADIYGKDLVSNIESRITTNGLKQQFGAIQGNTVLYQDNRNGNWDIYGTYTNFTPQYTLTVSIGGTGTGTVTSNPSGIDCGSDCTEDYNSGTVVTLTALPDIGSTFVGWSGEGCSGTGTCVVTMSVARNVTASFKNTFTLTVSKNGTGSGTVTSSPTGIDCGTTCNYDFDYNTEVTLSASAGTGSTFVGWSGEGCSGTGTCVVTMSVARNVTATFNTVVSSNMRYIPFVQNTLSFYSNIQIINVGTASATATVRLRDSSGSIVLTKDTSIINVGAYYQINSIIPWLGSSATEGYLEIESTEPIVVTGQIINSATNDPSNMVGRKYEEATDSPISVSVAGLTDWKSSLVVNNLGTSIANIELKEYDYSTGTLLATKTTTIPTQGYFYNNDIVNYMGLSATYGQLTVRSSNGQPLLVGTRNYNGNFGGYFDGQKIADADTTNILPYAIYSSQFYSNIQIINVGASPTTTTVYAIDSSGSNIMPSKTTASIPVNGYLQINNVLQWIGASSGSFGYVKIVSNSSEKLVTTGQFITNSNNDPSNMVGRRASETGTILSVSVAGLTDWKSSLTIVNMGGSTANITLKEFDTSGTLLATKTSTIPVNAIWYQNDIVAYMGLTNTYGFLEIISTNGQPVIAGTRNYNGNFGGFFNGQNIASIV